MATSLRNQRLRVLLVDPDRATLTMWYEMLRNVAHVEICSDFRSARTRLAEHPPDRLVTAARLGAYNGLHLAYMAQAGSSRTRTVVYSDMPDTVLAHEAQAMGAFYEVRERMPNAILSYVRSALPDRDRRNPLRFVAAPVGGFARRASES